MVDDWAQAHHFDGKGWFPVVLPASTCSPDGKSCVLPKAKIIHGTGRDNVWVAGHRALYVFDGKSWKGRYLGATIEDGSALFVDSPDHGWLGGEGEILEIRSDGTILHDLSGHQIISTFVRDKEALYAAGGSGYQLVTPSSVLTEEAYGQIWRFNRTSWDEEQSGVGMPISDSWLNPDDGSVWMLGEGVVRKALE